MATARLFILVFNLLLSLSLLLRLTPPNRVATSRSSNDKRKGDVIRQEQQLLSDLLLSHCHEADAFDLRSARQNKEHSSQSSSRSSSHNHSICSMLPLGATASSLWTKHAEKIFQASLHPNDVDQIHARWTKSMHNFLTPFLLERGLRTSPDHRALRKALRIVQRKLQHPHVDTVPPLEVAVVGGSVTEGGGCDKLGRGTPVGPVPEGREHPVIRGQMCAWPFRLQLLLDSFLGPGIVRVHNLAVGGTNSGLAIPLLDYWLFPEESPLLNHGPDVILNGYAANDNLPPPNKRGDDTNMTGDLSFFYVHGMAVAQGFIRASLQSRPCLEDPLVLFVDEYLGNQHNLILGELFRFEAVDLLTSWYSLSAGAISPANVIRRLIYANTDELIFSPMWRKPNGVKRIDVHAGMPSHVLTAWTVAFSIVSMVLHFCEEEKGRRAGNNPLPFSSPKSLELVQQAIPPVLDAELTVDRVSTLWHAEALDRNQTLAEYCAGSTRISSPSLPCSFAFVAAPMGTVKNARALNNYMKMFTVENDGWEGQQDIRNGWQNKLGYVATKEGASVLLRIDNATNKVSKLILHSLKSYGPKWERSKAKFTFRWFSPSMSASSGHGYETNFEIEGFHNQETSIAYPFVLDLSPDHVAERGSKLELQIDLIGGATFKINALMICSR